MRENFIETYDYHDFMQRRPEQHKVVIKICDRIKSNHKNKVIALNAGVKTGKKEIIFGCVLALSKFNIKLKAKAAKTVIHIYVTSLLQKDCQFQIKELEAYGVKAFAGITEKVPAEIERIIQEFDPSQHRNIIIHFDECDYGTGANQNFGKHIWNDWLPGVYKKYPNLSLWVIGYSATNWELLRSGLNPYKIEMVPNPFLYKGFGYYLLNKLVSESEPFFDFDDEGNWKISNQGWKCLELLDKSGKTYGIVRQLQYWKRMGEQILKRLQKEIKAKYPNFGEIIAIGRGNKEDLDWSYRPRKDEVEPPNSWLAKQTVLNGRTALLVVDQTFKRSTESSFHAHIAFYHDHRQDGAPTKNFPMGKIGSTLATMIQAFGRMCHYSEEAYQIRIFAKASVFEVGAGFMTLEEFYENGGKASNRLSTEKGAKLYTLAVTDYWTNDISETSFHKRDAALINMMEKHKPLHFPQHQHGEGKIWRTTTVSDNVADNVCQKFANGTLHQSEGLEFNTAVFDFKSFDKNAIPTEKDFIKDRGDEAIGRHEYLAAKSSLETIKRNLKGTPNEGKRFCIRYTQKIMRKTEDIEIKTNSKSMFTNSSMMN